MCTDLPPTRNVIRAACTLPFTLFYTPTHIARPLCNAFYVVSTCIALQPQCPGPTPVER
jgi:hypothetical protein